MQLSHISTSPFDQFLPYTLKGVAPTSIPQISHMQTSEFQHLFSGDLTCENWNQKLP